MMFWAPGAFVSVDLDGVVFSHFKVAGCSLAIQPSSIIYFEGPVIDRLKGAKTHCETKPVRYDT